MTCDAGFSIGILCVRYYGIILMLGALAGGYLATLEVKRRGHDPEMVWDLLVYLIIGGVLGARLWHVLTPPPSSLVLDPITGAMVNPYFVGGVPRILDILSIWRGGLGIPGTIIGGLIALYVYTRQHREIAFLEWADIAAPSLALGQAIGRWGNFVNQEIYGAPTNLPWKIEIDPAHRLAGFESQAFYHPLFAYESILNFANMLLLIWITRRYQNKLRRGDVFNVYLIFYPAVRFGLDFVRLDAAEVLGLNINQTIMAVVCVLAVGVLIWRHRPSASSDEAPRILRETASGASVPTKRTTASATRAKRAPSRSTARRPVARRKTAKKV